MCKVVPGKNLGILRLLVNDTKSLNTGVLNLWVATPLGGFTSDIYIVLCNSSKITIMI